MLSSSNMARLCLYFTHHRSNIYNCHRYLCRSRSLSWHCSFSSSSSVNTYADTLAKIRNIGISAHIDSGKTTLTERILFYTGRIKEIHEVKGKDQIGATMDSMDLEREKGITIQSAATHATWGSHRINIIDTPGHVDFTIEVERALRVLDGAIMVLCGVAGVQSQSLTVDRQMKRYNVPRIAFINKLDRAGSNPYKPLKDIRNTLMHNAALMQIPIGSDMNFQGVVDVIAMKAFYFDGANGEIVRVEEIPADLRQQAIDTRAELIERVSEVDDPLAELFMEGKEPSEVDLRSAVRRATISRKFVPVLMGSAYKNKGVQPLLDAVVSYLPQPNEKQNIALDIDNDEQPVELVSDPKLPFVGLAFKLEERPFGQLTYVRVYQGTLKKGDFINDVAQKKRVKVQRIVQMHASHMQDVDQTLAGDISALFGIDCASGSTFTGANLRLSLTSMHVPDPVISLSIKPKDTKSSGSFMKALIRFQREDPTFRVHTDENSSETIISGMGELHLDVYVERMRREYKVDCVVGQPKVNYRETCQSRAEFNYLHKKQSGGAGQFGRVIGYIEPLTEEEIAGGKNYEFKNQLVGNVIPPELHTSIEKGFNEAIQKGLAGYPVTGVRIVITDGQAHPVDSNDNAFRAAAKGAFRQGFNAAQPTILEPIMNVQVEVPPQFQGTAVASVNKKRGVVNDVATHADGQLVVVDADIPLSKMFGYSTDLRSSTEGKGEFSMEYKHHAPVMRDEQEAIMADAERRRGMKNDE